MTRGIIYIMTIAVPGLIKIGKTGLDNLSRKCINWNGMDTLMSLL